MAARSVREDQTVLNPATGEVIAEVQQGTEEDVARAVAAARKAFDGGWSELDPARARRSATEARGADRRARRRAGDDRLAERWGKPLALTISEELPLMADHLRFFAGATPSRCTGGRRSTCGGS